LRLTAADTADVELGWVSLTIGVPEHHDGPIGPVGVDPTRHGNDLKQCCFAPARAGLVASGCDTLAVELFHVHGNLP
jgi:hypothetical protein